MQFITQLLHQIGSALLAFWQQTEQSRWFPLLVGAVVFSVILGIVNFGIGVARRPSGKRMPFWIAWIELKFLFTDELIPLACLWLAYATPFDRLPFIPPTVSDHWWFLPALTTYTWIAVLAHGFLSLYGTFTLIAGWLVQFRTPDLGRFDFIVLTIAFLAMIWGWEIQNWPELFLVTSELIMALIFGLLIGAWVVGPRKIIAIGESRKSSPEALAVAHAYFATFAVVWTLSLFFIVLWHQLSWYLVTLGAVYYIVTLADFDVMMCFKVNSYRRAFFLFPATLILAFVAASGVFRLVTHNSEVSYNLWLEVGVAAAVYMLLFPLTEMARRVVQARIRDEPEQRAVLIAARILESFMASESKAKTESLAVAPGETVVDADATKHKSAANTQVAQSSEDHRRAVAIDIEGIAAAGRRAQVAYESLNAHVWIILLLATMVFHYFAGFPDVLAGLGGNLLTVVFGALSLFAGLLAVLATGNDNDPTRSVLLFLLMLTMGVIAGDVLLNYVPVASGAVAAAPASLLTAIHDQHYILATAHSIFQELLFLMAIGQIAYLIIVVNSNLRTAEESAR